MGRALAGKTILIVEDNYLVGEDLRLTMSEAGADALGPVKDARACAMALERPVDGVLLDVQLGEEPILGQTSAKVANLLRQRHIPFIVVTGYRQDCIPQILRGAPFLAKPVAPGFLTSLAQEVFG